MHRLTLLRDLVHPTVLRDALRPAPATGTLPGALRCGTSVALTFAVVALAGHPELSGFASLGALASLYGRSAGYAPGGPGSWRSPARR